MRGWRTALVAAWAAVAFAAPSAADVDRYLGRPIATVRLTIEGRPVDSGPLLALIETRQGSPLTMRDVRETITHLFSAGVYETVVVHAVDEAAGVALVYDLLPIHPVTRIAFTGDVDAAGVDVDDLRRAVVERYGDAPSAGRLSEIAALVEERLAARGYLSARATPRTDLVHEPDRATLVIDVACGVRAQVGTVDVEGAERDRAALLDRLHLRAGAPYEPEVIDRRVTEYLADRRREGFMEAALTIVPRFTPDRSLAHLLVTAVPGPRVRVVFAGDPLPEDERERLVPIAAEGSADEDLLEDSSNRIQEYLRAQGFRDASAPYTRETVDDELRVTFTVRRGPQYRVGAVEVTGSAAMRPDQLTALMTLRSGQPFEAARLEADVSAIQNAYRRLGYAAVSVEPSAEPLPRDNAPDVPVLVRLRIEEGVRTVVRTVQFDGNRTLGDDLLSSGLGLAPGEPFFSTQMALDRDAVQLKYADLGFHTATVEANPGFNANGAEADVVFTINEGPQLVVDHVVVVGNGRTRRETIARELQLGPGDPLGLAAVNESQRRLAALGLFRRVRLTQVDHGDETRRDLLVSVDEAPATSIAYGPGVEVVPRTRRSTADSVARQTVEFAPRGFFEIGRRNLFGKNRSVNLFTRLSLRSRDAVRFGDDSEEAPTTEASTFGFAEYRVLGTFSEPRVFDSPADALLTAVTEQQSRSSFNFARRAFSADLIRRVTRFVSISGNYQIQRTELFDEQINPEDRLLVDRLFPQVRLSSFSTSVVRDTRDDQLNPGFGTYMSANTQAAGRRIGSEVGLLKTYLTGQVFRTVPGTGNIVFAASGRLGMATAFTREVARVDAAGAPVLDESGEPVVDLLEDLPASERFFAGGDTTVRGFALDQLGTRDTIDTDGFPIGGNALVILNAELRVPLAGGLGAVGFFDAGNVFARTRAIDFGELRTAVGFGVRYQSPVGPIRVDIGFKLRPREVVPGHPESPRAVHISLGQAF